MHSCDLLKRLIWSADSGCWFAGLNPLFVGGLGVRLDVAFWTPAGREDPEVVSPGGLWVSGNGPYRKRYEGTPGVCGEYGSLFRGVPGTSES